MITNFNNFINENNNSEILNEGLHDRYKEGPWTRKDNLIAFYCAQYNPRDLLPARGIISDYASQILANYYIGTSETSLKMQTENFVFLLTDGKEGLSDFSTVQKIVFYKYNNFNKEELFDECMDILKNIDVNTVYAKFKKSLDDKTERNLELKKSKLRELRRIEDNERRFKEEFDRIIGLKGMNPRKLRHLGTREVKREQPHQLQAAERIEPKQDITPEPFVTDHRDNIKLDRLKDLGDKIDNAPIMDLSRFKEKKNRFR